MIQLKGKVALIAGGSGAIGAASVLLFAEAGAAVITTHRPGKDAEGAAVLGGLPGAGHLALPLQIDDGASVDALIDRMFAVVRAFAPMLKASGDGLIVSISFIAAVSGQGSSIAYCAAKAGINVMTKSLARALAPAVRVLAVSPGVVSTGLVPGRGEEFNQKTASTTPLKRVATAQAVLACATHLTFSTGQTIVVDGGRSL